MNLSFAPLPNDDPRGDNAVMANFRDENLSLTDIFIREFLQNVLDNRVELEDGKYQIANIVINICEVENNSNKQFINHIFDHSTLSSINSLEDINFEPDSLRALIIEENNTKGITGLRDSSDDQGNWAKFWHAQSSSDKRGNKNGRAGQGKISYHMVSNVYTVFGLTSPVGDSSKLYLMGKCILPSNPIINHKTYKPHAFISHHQKHDDGSDQPIPFDDNESIQAFSNAFSLSRRPGDFGTSWVIPFPKENIKEIDIIKSTISGYFYSILMRKLTIQVGSIVINDETIIDYVKKYLSKTEAEFYEFIKNSSDTDVIYNRQQLPQKWLNKSSIPEEILSEEKIDQLRGDFSSGKIVCVKLPVVIDSIKEGKITSYFCVYLQNKPGLEDSLAAFVRTDLIISKESEFLLRQQGSFFGLIVADHEPIANFLANCEEPNHTKFNHVMKAAEKKYTKNSIKKTLTNIRMGASRVYSFLEETDSGMHADALIDVLSIMGFKKPPIVKPPKEDPEIVTDDEQVLIEGPEVPPVIFSDNKYFNVTDEEGVVTISPGVEKFNYEDLPVGLNIKAGYMSLDSGDIFTNHHHLDFDFTDSKSIFIKQNGISNIENLSQPNILKLKIESLDFSLQLSGFSLVERLRVKLTPFEIEK